MFYPVDSLKRGGRFYLCWVADSWPLRFATITHRQLWSQDIRRICDDLLEVMTNESGRPNQRFSLRLSSQLLRGLVRLYQRKVNVFLGDLCMINAHVIKSTNKKWNVQEIEVVERVRRPLQQLNIQEILQEPQENEQRIEEMIQASGNAVANIQDITLREPVEHVSVAEMLSKPNDGFGEEQLDQPLQFLQDRTLEMMLVNTEVSTAHSGLELAGLDNTDKSQDKSRLYLHDAQMERISEHELTMFRKSTAEELIPEFEKDIPEIPEIPPPELSVPQPEKPREEEHVPEEPRFIPVAPPREPEPEEIELEALEPQPRRRRIRNRLIIDKKIKISTQQFRARLENTLLELRCQDSSDDIISIRVPPELYFRRPCQGGVRVDTNIGFEISRLFSRNLGVVSVQPRAEREMEEVMQRSNRTAARSMLERIEEEPEIPVVPEEPQVLLEPTTAPENITAELMNVSEAPRVSVVEQMELDIADMPTQKVETLSQARKRVAEQEVGMSPKRQRSVGYVSFRESQIAQQRSNELADLEADKENRSSNLPPLLPPAEPAPEQSAEKIVSSMLQEAGLADIQITAPIVTEAEIHTSLRAGSRGKSGRGNQSDSSETPLGSLDRTKVSLGDSDHTTDSKRFIRDQWGTEGTMLKILKFVKTGRQPVTVSNLISKGPIIAGHKRVIAARCFSSILKLRQHRFINVSKDPDTLEITNITLGPKLTSSQEQI
ncbi:uncharacterized protein LOC142975764 [Anticarsia gemmatalis]|uniref:uncharacterized protein LOC142975764 n=1 Tax=Anticarsia gemmatalis TaxID=129554 RepID=UPI003F773679